MTDSSSTVTQQLLRHDLLGRSTTETDGFDGERRDGRHSVCLWLEDVRCRRGQMGAERMGVVRRRETGTSIHCRGGCELQGQILSCQLLSTALSGTEGANSEINHVVVVCMEATED